MLLYIYIYRFIHLPGDIIQVSEIRVLERRARAN